MLCLLLTCRFRVLVSMVPVGVVRHLRARGDGDGEPPSCGTAQDQDGDFSRRAAELAAAIRLGYEVERDDPNIGFESPPDDEIEWLAAFLVSEGWNQER